jgi:N-acetylglucosaminyldiphosphoundecaprenol N-acetyl-beta-D-mannosaminyltransferase
VRVLETGISATSYAEACRLLARWGLSGQRAYVCICNVHTVMEAHRSPDYAAILNGAAMATPDGMPLVWALRRRGHPDQGRVYGPDLLLAFAEFAAAKPELSSYFYGGGEGVAAELAGVLAGKHPGFKVAGFESPPFRPLSPEEDAAAVERINASGAAVLWVGLGAPRQERWMAEHLGRVKPVMVGVGAAFDFHTGRVRQAPRWMMGCGLEWFFRLAVEPRRLWRRYALNNPHFLWHMLRR